MCEALYCAQMKERVGMTRRVGWREKRYISWVELHPQFKHFILFAVCAKTLLWLHSIV